MSLKDYAIGVLLGVLGAGAFCGTVWMVLDAYTRIAYASLGIPYP